MVDPLTIATASGVASGLATFWSMEASNWVKSFFVNHHPKAIEKAQQNTSDFLIELSNKVSKLENNKIDLAGALEDPDFSAAFQKAVLASAQTDNNEKHHLLADILAQRLTVESETTISLAAKMSLDVITFLTPNQLNILAASVVLYKINAAYLLDSKFYNVWVEENLSPYLDLNIMQSDLLHLESLSCIKMTDTLTRDLKELFRVRNYGQSLDQSFYETENIKKLENLWKGKIEKIDLTTVGLLLGVTTYNFKSKNPITQSNIFDF